MRLKTRLLKIWKPIWKFLNANKVRGRIAAIVLILILTSTGLLVAFKP